MKAELLKQLAEIVGTDYVSDCPEELYLHSPIVIGRLITQG